MYMSYAQKTWNFTSGGDVPVGPPGLEEPHATIVPAGTVPDIYIYIYIYIYMCVFLIQCAYIGGIAPI